MAENFLKRGCRVVISGRGQDAVEQVVSELSAEFGGDNVVGASCDITDIATLQSLWDCAVSAFGLVDVWINNAGMDIAHKPIYEAEADDLKRLVEANVLGILYANKIVMAGMKEQGHGQIWNMEGFGSNGMSQKGMAPYGATKRAVNYLNTALRKDAAGTGVQVCTLSPGMVLTDLLLQDMDTSSEDWPRMRRMFNILADTVDTVTPWLVDGVLKANKDGAKVMWLTGPKIGMRFLLARFSKRDLFADRGM
jgi:NADP-dependent 3-hydroxy acid dehydrogenase YdfG